MQITARSDFPYRAEIDGLRAVAILLVVFYHLRTPGFDGGFIGVDLFFTISGFLIFSLLKREYESVGRVNWAGFFARRAVRLLPEATTMILVVVAVGSILLPPDEREALASSAMAGALWSANLYFWRFGEDYFAWWSERQPLLHLWSLGVEEQFYAVVPVMFVSVLALSRRSGKSWLYLASLVLIGAGVGSLLLAAWGIRDHATATYYLLPTRAYEFAIGAFAALRVGQCGPLRERTLFLSVLATLSVIGVVVSASLVSKENRFSGAWALLPATSIASVMFCGAFGALGVFRHLLEAKPLVYLGKVSYGWYLWHFPLIVYWREYWLFDTTLLGEAVIAAAALLPAAIGYHLVGRLRRNLGGRLQAATAQTSVPHRLPHHRYWRLDAKGLVMFVAPVVLILAVAGSVWTHARFIASQEVDAQLLAKRQNDIYAPAKPCTSTDIQELEFPRSCQFGDPTGTATLVLLGDSHANHWVPALEPLFVELNIRGVNRSFYGCLPGFSPRTGSHSEWLERCQHAGEKTLLDLEQRKSLGPVGVILSARWAAYVNATPLSVLDRRVLREPWAKDFSLDASLSSLAAALSRLQIPVGVIQQIPEQKYNVPLCLWRRQPRQCEISWSLEQAYLRASERPLSNFVQRMRAETFDPVPVLCDSERCAVSLGETLLYHDDDHLSVSGARHLSSAIRALVENMKRKVLSKTPLELANG